MKEAILVGVAGGVGFLLTLLIPNAEFFRESDIRLLRGVGVGGALAGAAIWAVVLKVSAGRMWWAIVTAVIAASLAVFVFSALSVRGIALGAPGAEQITPLVVWTAVGLFAFGVLLEAAGVEVIDRSGGGDGND